MRNIHPTTHPWTAAAEAPFHKSWNTVGRNDKIPSFLQHGVFRFFIAIASFIIFPVYIYLHSNFVVTSVVPVLPVQGARDVSAGSLSSSDRDKTTIEAHPPKACGSKLTTTPSTSRSKEAGLPNFTSSETSNVCYLNACIQMIQNTSALNLLVRNSLAAGGEPFNLRLKQALVNLLNALDSKNPKTIKKVQTKLANTYITSDEWRNCTQDATLIGAQQDSMSFFRFAFDRLELDHQLFRVAMIHREIEYRDYGTENVNKRAKQEEMSLPMLNISWDGTVQDAVDALFVKTWGPPRLTEIKPDDGDSEISARWVFEGLGRKLLEGTPAAKDMLKLLDDVRQESEFETDSPTRRAALRILNMNRNGISFKNLEEAQELYVGKVCSDKTFVMKKQSEMHSLISHPPVLMFEIAHVEATGRLNRKDDKFLPDEEIVVSGRRYRLEGVINRPGNHYTYLRRNEKKNWTHFNDSTVSDVPRLEAKSFFGYPMVGGQGCALKSLVYALVEEVETED